MGIQKLIMEGDALQVVNNLSKNKTNWSQGGLLIEDAKILLNSFVSWPAHHTKREANKKAHNLDRDALKLHEDLYDMEEVPSYIRSTILSEMM